MSAFRPLRRLAMICALPAMLAAPAAADPTLGLGVSFSYGSGQVNTGAGLRVFTNDRRNSVAGSLGVDYMFNTQAWRGTVGAAYLRNKTYFGLDLGIGLLDGAFDFGAAVGVTNTKRPPRRSPAPIEPVPMNGPTPQ